MVSSHEVREMRRAVLELTINPGRETEILTTGELLDIERVTSSSERGHWKRAAFGGNALVLYSTDYVFGCDIADHNPASLKAFQKAGYRVETKVEQPPGGKVRYCFDLVLSRERYAETLEKT